MFNCPICGKAIGCPTRGKTKKKVSPHWLKLTQIETSLAQRISIDMNQILLQTSTTYMSCC